MAETDEPLMNPKLVICAEPLITSVPSKVVTTEPLTTPVPSKVLTTGCDTTSVPSRVRTTELAAFLDLILFLHLYQSL